MLDLLKRHYSVLTILTIGACSSFAGRAAVHVVEARYLSSAALPLPAARAGRARATAAALAQRRKDTTAILERNLFCSTCPPILPKDHEPAVDDEAGKEVVSTLPYDLVATVTDGEPTDAFAFVRHTIAPGTRNDRGQVVRVAPLALWFPGRAVADDRAVVDHIDDHRVYLKVDEHVEYLELPDFAKRDAGPKGRFAPPPSSPRPGGIDFSRGVRKVSETRYEIDRRMLDQVLADTNAIGRSARIVPSVSPRDGRPNGFKLYAIRPGSLYSAIGLQNGDTLSAVNDQPLDNPARAFELYSKLRTASGVQLGILRRGRPMTIDYSIR